VAFWQALVGRSRPSFGAGQPDRQGEVDQAGRPGVLQDGLRVAQESHIRAGCGLLASTTEAAKPGSIASFPPVMDMTALSVPRDRWPGSSQSRTAKDSRPCSVPAPPQRP
jgi:hypothetical protein